MSNSRLIPALCTALLAATLHLNAVAADAVEVKSVAEQEIEVVEKGKKVVKRVPVDKAIPGSEILYTTTFRNLIDKPVGNIAITNPVPNDMVYKGGSARGANTAITYSVDGGKQYATPDKLTVKTPDGKVRPALASDYTHIRWTYRGDLGVGKSGEVSFRAAIK